ncbi:hypothetical protein [Streptomyces sp. NPDC087294]|uniref:hypothetical protein n=1 Tax=Streptomyces sp. NPDC087294 TaxID=3365777 RepID=UPI00381ABCA4
MGWVHPHDETADGDHEGDVVVVFPDGSESPVSTFEEEAEWDGSAWRRFDGREGRPLAVGIRAACACGWRGRKTGPVDRDAPQATVELPLREWAHHAEAALCTVLPPDMRRVLGDIEWRLADLAGTSWGMVKRRRAQGDTVDLITLGEVRPLAAVHAAAVLRRMAASVEDDAVREALKTFGWDEIGRALGITRQAAHQRLRHLDPKTPAEGA